MGHECPVCGLQCHCNGDIDDLFLDTPEAVNRCTHCPDEDDNVSVEDFEDDDPNLLFDDITPERK